VVANTATAIPDFLVDTTNNDNNNSFLPYNWKEQWYAVTFASHLPDPSKSAEVTPASVFGVPLVIWRDENNNVYCADDVCPHRVAALSEGRVRNGKLECYYHGWQFDGANGGKSNFIPQLDSNAIIPKRACLQMRECQVVEGIVWVWMGENGKSKFNPPIQGDGLHDIHPTTGKHPDSNFFINDFQCDMPYDWSYLAENLLDPAHIAISHDAMVGGGKRADAQAYEMIIDTDSIGPGGFTGRYRTAKARELDSPFMEVNYVAPGIIRSRIKPRNSEGITFGAALHCMPLSMGRSRLLFRVYIKNLPPIAKFIIRLTPQWARNLNSCKILEQDAGLITTQEDYFTRNTHRTMKEDYLLLSSSDAFVKTYRMWLDNVGHGMPWFQGLSTQSMNISSLTSSSSISPPLPPNLDSMYHRAGVLETRYHRHVIHCPSTRNALSNIQMLKKVLISTTLAIITISFGMLLSVGGPLTNEQSLAVLQHQQQRIRGIHKLLKVLVSFIPVTGMAAAALHKLEKHFFISFKRKDQLRTESGLLP
jgi:phenylpropionate dioxygenase-like ring-hydroxylating dioxygenase large terminal subunit